MRKARWQRGRPRRATPKIPRRAVSIPGQTWRLVKIPPFPPVAERSGEIRLLFRYETHYSYGKKKTKPPPVALRGLDQPHKEYVSDEEEGLFAIKVMEFPGARWRNK